MKIIKTIFATLYGIIAGAVSGAFLGLGGALLCDLVWIELFFDKAHGTEIAGSFVKILIIGGAIVGAIIGGVLSGKDAWCDDKNKTT